MSEYVWVNTASGDLSLYPEVARALGHRDHAYLDGAQFWEAIRANARYGNRVCEAKIAKQNSGDPPPQS